MSSEKDDVQKDDTLKLVDRVVYWEYEVHYLLGCLQYFILINFEWPVINPMR